MKDIIANGRIVSRLSASYSMRKAQEIRKLRVENFTGPLYLSRFSRTHACLAAFCK